MGTFYTKRLCMLEQRTRDDEEREERERERKSLTSHKKFKKFPPALQMPFQKIQKKESPTTHTQRTPQKKGEDLSSFRLSLSLSSLS